MYKLGIVGASGYTGAELVRLLAGHPQVQVVAATSESFAGQTLSDVYPALGPCGKITLTKLEKTDLSSAAVDLVFLGLPHGESQQITPRLLQSGVKVIDLSGDFRFQDTTVYETWYKHPHTQKTLATQAVYGMPELFRAKIKTARLIANPGCYVTAAVLALYPLLKHRVVDFKTLIVDAKSGVSGAGRQPKPETHFNRVSENIIPYKLAGTHQHTPEMEMALSQATGLDVTLTFSPHLVPARRGIVALAYGRLTKSISTEALHQLFVDTYVGEPFVRVSDQAVWPDLASAVGSNTCIVKVGQDQRTGLVVVASALDNLIKGASGQAIQNMNLLFGLEESLGLPQAGLIP